MWHLLSKPGVLFRGHISSLNRVPWVEMSPGKMGHFAGFWESPGFSLKNCYNSTSRCSSSVSDWDSGLEWDSNCALWSHGRLPGRRHVQGVLGHAEEWDPPDPATQASKVRIFTDDGGGYPRCLEHWILLWTVLVLCQVKLVVSDLHVRLKSDEIRMLVMLRMNHEFMEYMRVSYPDTPLSEFKVADTYVYDHGGVDTLDDDEDDE